MPTTQLKTSILVATCLIIVACGSNTRHIPMQIHSDPLGAYTMIQVKYQGLSHSDWIYLGTTPIDIDRGIALDDATEISIKVVRPGFHDSIKTWKAKEFIKEYKQNRKILWVPNMVEQ